MFRVRPLTLKDRLNFQHHFDRHCAESGQGEHHFIPFVPAHPDGPQGVDFDALNRPLSEPGWQRWFIALAHDGNIVGHADLKGDGLTTGLHRCELGIGIERPYRGKGLGRKLMNTAIEFAHASQILAWIDLRVFAHNTIAQALYRSLGFVEIGTVPDRFRIEDKSIDDVLMALRLST